MNILFSVPRLHTNYSAMIQGLIEGGHRVSFIAMDGGTVHVPSEYDIPVYHLRAKKRMFTPGNYVKQFHFESFSNLNTILKKEQPDLIITRDLMMLNSQLALLGKTKGIPTIYYDQIPPSYSKSVKRSIWYFIIHTFISRYRLTTVNRNSTDSKDQKNVFFVPFAVPYTPVKKSYPSHFSAENPLKIVVISKLGDKRKNLLFLLEALLPFFDKGVIQLSIYGMLKKNQSSRKHFDSITDFISTHELSESIHLHKNREHQEVLNAYSRHHLFILPSLNEPAAISPFEAMSSGLPVIVTEQNGTNYVIKDGKNGFIFNPKNKKELQEKVGFFLNNPETIELFSREALKTINQNYSPENFSNEIIRVFKRIKDE